MKTMDHYNHPVAKVICTIFGGIIGVKGYLFIHLGFDPTMWGSLLEKAVSIFGACVLAGTAGFSSYAGTLLAKRVFKKHIAKEKDSDE